MLGVFEFETDLEDPREMRNAYASPRHAARIAEMKREIHRLREKYLVR